MNERRAIVEAFKKARTAKIKCALATVTNVRGSSYRRPGAKMLVTEDGEIAGSVSGGCLERDLIQRAIQAMQLAERKLIQYDTSLDRNEQFENSIQNVSLGCEGLIEILLDPAADAVIDAMERADSEGKQIVIEQNLASAGQEKIFFHVLDPQVDLIVFGAGHDAIAMSRLAHEIGWRVSVVDCRSSFAIPKKLFSHVDAIIQGEPDQVLGGLRLTKGTVCVIMTHNYEHDRSLLRQLIQSPVNYIGMLGPKTRSERILGDLKKEKVALTDRSRLHFPIGLDIGGEGPSAIALAVLAEVQAVLNGRNAGFLKNRCGPIHETIQESNL